jgi:hypothetical protein
LSQLGRIINGFLTLVNENGNWRRFEGEIEMFHDDFALKHFHHAALEGIKSASFRFLTEKEMF